MTSPMITAIRGLLDAQGWDDEIQTHPASGSAFLGTSLCIEGHWCDLMVLADLEDRWIKVVLEAPFRIAPANHLKACMLASRVLAEDACWRLRVDPDDGGLCTITTADYRGCPDPGPGIVPAMTSAAVRLFERCLDDFWKLSSTDARALQ